jgi:hypothetical protein
VSAELIEAIRTEWTWIEIDPEAVTAISQFGHLIVRDTAGAFWYLDPELRTLERIADDEAGLFRHMNDPEVREVWEARALVERAIERIGPPGPGRCYSLSIVSLLAGDYSKNDFWHPPLTELIGVMGSIERQTRDLPEGSAVALKIVD